MIYDVYNIVQSNWPHIWYLGHVGKILNYMVRCEHCDVDAYYNMTIEDFNDAQSVSNNLCVKCVKVEMKKMVFLSYAPIIIKKSIANIHIL